MTNSAEQSGHEEQSIRSLVTRYGEDMKRLIYSYVKSWSVAEDLVQEVFITVYQKIDTLEKEASVKAWIFSIAANKSKDYLRSWHYRKLLFTNTFSIKTNKEGTEDLLIQHQQKTALSEAIFALPVKYREVIIFFYYQELKIEEISTILGVNSSTIRTRLARARDLLNQKLGGDLDES
ncbi:sigma-70 family RNA polymerase sigma factor [Rossellomorea vietnamensis]|uniref:sigma-70 family RNA polymerase sigma factor n=1 Tax=Rossellomorea vietnamensis TaxID=218284 RepID=UPI001CD03540|nr:sigma-70 family RNA polymerase sigma factor [Rossellomorea vietnamensis]MCA0147191.1 sigma-70 family RNA polymerase sigma factor [Rossellomorea vietnamensis]